MTDQPGARRTPSSGRPAPRKAAPSRPAAGGAATPPGGPKRPAPTKRTGKQWAWLIARWALAALLSLVLIAVVAFFIMYKTTSIPSANKAWQVQTSHVYYDDGKTPIGNFTENSQNRTSIPYDQMPDTIKNAVVAAEDHTFWTNNGIDLKGIIRAARSNASGNAQQGASTITQQYVKILYLGQSNGHLSYSQKLKEIFVALKMHNQLSKQQILEGYLNTIYFGRGAYGIEAAAEAYFHIHAKQLNVKQAAVIASILNQPSALDPANGKTAKAELKSRYDYTLEWMGKLGSIPETVAAKDEKRLPPFPKETANSSWSGQTGHIMTLVKSQLEALGFTDEQIDGGGLQITTTINKSDEQAVIDGVNQIWADGPSGLPGLKDFSNKTLHTAVASVQPGTGALKAMYAGQPYQDSTYDWAVQGGMVGSTMKAATLTTGLEAGFSLKDTFQGDSPYTFPDGTTVTNEGQSLANPAGESYGRVSAITALQQSVNTAFVDMTESIPDGPDKIVANANKMGVPPVKADQDYPGIPDTSRDLVPDARVTLGRAVISPINMANMYATIAAEGKRADVHVVTKVVDPNGTVLYQNKNTTQQVIPQDVSDDVSYALQQVAIGGTGDKNASPSDLGRPDAGKTGTATADAPDGDQYVSSAWYVGFTPQLSTAVMYVRGDGNDPLNWTSVTDHSSWMPSYFGADYPAATWNAVMKGELSGQPVEQFPPPAWVDGTAPASGHAPAPAYTPPPKPTNKPAPPKKPTKPAKPTKPSKPSAPETKAPPVAPPPPGNNGNGNGNGFGNQPQPSAQPTGTSTTSGATACWPTSGNPLDPHC